MKKKIVLIILIAILGSVEAYFIFFNNDEKISYLTQKIQKKRYISNHRGSRKGICQRSSRCGCSS